MLYKGKKILEVYFYTETSGNEPVREWLRSLNDKDRKKLGRDILSVQYEWPIGMPLIKSLGKGLWEIRTNLDNRIARIIFIIENSKMILLHGFIKKTRAISSYDFTIAIRRAKNISMNKEMKENKNGKK